MLKQKTLSPKQNEELLKKLRNRFEQNLHRHQGLSWNEVQNRLEKNPLKLWSLYKMEETGGEPDVIGYDKKTGEYIFVDCSGETPSGRRNICYDNEGQEIREKQGIHPQGNAVDLAATMGITLLNEEQYRELQKFGNFDTKTSSWLKTPEAIRKHGGAIFADRRFEHIFIYHNTAPTFYAARGFRGELRV